MHKEVMRAIAGIDIFPVISLVLFVIVFGAAVIRALRLDRRLVEQLSLLPLDGPPDDGDRAHGTHTQHSALRTRHFSEVFRVDQA
jgi:hypothetical protein